MGNDWGLRAAERVRGLKSYQGHISELIYSPRELDLHTPAREKWKNIGQPETFCSYLWANDDTDQKKQETHCSPDKVDLDVTPKENIDHARSPQFANQDERPCGASPV